MTMEVQVPDEDDNVEGVSARPDIGNVVQERENVSRRPGDGEQHADKQHRLDDVGLDLL